MTNNKSTRKLGWFILVSLAVTLNIGLWTVFGMGGLAIFAFLCLLFVFSSFAYRMATGQEAE